MQWQPPHPPTHTLPPIILPNLQANSFQQVFMNISAISSTALAEELATSAALGLADIFLTKDMNRGSQCKQKQPGSTNWRASSWSMMICFILKDLGRRSERLKPHPCCGIMRQSHILFSLLFLWFLFCFLPLVWPIVRVLDRVLVFPRPG